MLSSEDKMQITIDYVKELAIEFKTFTGAIIFHNDKIIAKTMTSIDKDQNPLAHAEIKALEYINKRYQDVASELELYTTQKPCKMCASAIVWTGIKKVYFGKSTNHHWDSNDEIFDFFNNQEVVCEGPMLENRINQIDEMLKLKGI